jgi:predicted  nucleic acid-binding Zn-ribbon protein
METPDQKKGKASVWIILLLLSVALNAYQWFHSTTVVTSFEQKVDTLYVERTNIEKELTDARTELNKYWGINAGLDSLLKEANAKIDDQEKEIHKIRGQEKNYATLNTKLQAQLKDLQSLRDDYLGRIDSLLIANKQLQSEKEQLTGNVQNLTKNLETTVSTASVLKAEYLTTKSYKRKSNGKYVESALAKRTHKMEVCFDVLDNKITRTGDKNVYLKITEPGGKPVGNKSTGSASFKTTSGEEVMYTASTTINYTGAKQNVCLSYEEKEDKMFPPGTYLIEVYVDGNLSGASSYVLK